MLDARSHDRRRFADAHGKPVDLGEACTGPTGDVPTCWFTSDAATWQVNAGNGGGFTLDGLAPAPTSPSD